MYLLEFGKVNHSVGQKLSMETFMTTWLIPQVNLFEHNLHSIIILFYILLIYNISFKGVFTRESMKSRKGLEAHNYFKSGWVESVLCHQTDKIKIILTSEVRHSQALNEEKLRPWVVASNTGNILCAHCTCMAGCVC